jgi:hypothetical protein
MTAGEGGANALSLILARSAKRKLVGEVLHRAKLPSIVGLIVSALTTSAVIRACHLPSASKALNSQVFAMNQGTARAIHVPMEEHVLLQTY